MANECIQYTLPSVILYLFYHVVRAMFAEHSRTDDAHSFSGRMEMAKDTVVAQKTDKLVITKANYDLAFYIFLKEIQMHLLPDLF